MVGPTLPAAPPLLRLDLFPVSGLRRAIWRRALAGSHGCRPPFAVAVPVAAVLVVVIAVVVAVWGEAAGEQQHRVRSAIHYSISSSAVALSLSPIAAW